MIRSVDVTLMRHQITLWGIWEDVGEYVGDNLLVAVVARDLTRKMMPIELLT